VAGMHPPTQAERNVACSSGGPPVACPGARRYPPSLRGRSHCPIRMATIAPIIGRRRYMCLQPIRDRCVARDMPARLLANPYPDHCNSSLPTFTPRSYPQAHRSSETMHEPGVSIRRSCLNVIVPRQHIYTVAIKTARVIVNNGSSPRIARDTNRLTERNKGETE
jgi:hypothetical protein